jgi:methionyl-tRNA formyltransferase
VLVDNRFGYLKNKFKNLIKESVLFCFFQDISWYKARRIIEKKITMLIPANFDSHIKKINVKDVNGFDTEKVIRDLKPDILIQCGAGILKENIFSIPKIGTLNVHHGIAPELRGISSTFWAMYYGLLEFIGTTVHFIDKTLDTGTVIIQKKTILPEKYDYVEAVFQTSVQGADLLPEAIRIVQNGYLIVEKEVKSFYFSSVNYQKYSELKRNNFRPVGNIDALKYKMKCKKVLVPKL